MEELEEFDKNLKEVLEELKEQEEDEELQALLYDKELDDKPSIFTHPLADIIRELKTIDETRKEYDEQLVGRPKLVERIQPISTKLPRSPSRRSVRTAKSMRYSSLPKQSTSMFSRKQLPRESKISGRASQVPRTSQNISRKSKAVVDSSEGSHSGSEEIVHIANVTIKNNFQKELKCEVGVDIFMEMPWKIISKFDIMKSIKLDAEQSPFYEYASSFQNYPEEEVLIGRASLMDNDSFLVAVTLYGRTLILEEIKQAHLDRWRKVLMLSNHPIGIWKSLGSEKEMDIAGIKNSRPQIGFDCYIKKDHHEKLFSEGFDVVDYYTELREEGLLMIENVNGIVFDKQTQSCPLTKESYAQTVPEIPANSATQFTTEMRVEEYKELLEELDIDYDVLNEKLKGFFNKMDTLLTYNEEYDLYRDDYEILATEGEKISMYPNIPYEHYATMVTFIGTKDRVITSASWHPSQPGLVAVSYGREHINNIGDLENNSDEEEVDKNAFDEEALFKSFPTTNKFDEYIEKLWKQEIRKLEKNMRKKKHDTEAYDLATASTEFILQTKHIRLFEIIQEKKRILKTPDAADLYEEEKFEYLLFDEVKKRKKLRDNKNESIDSIINKVVCSKPDYLKRDYLFSGNFHWKLKMADDLINPVDLLILARGGTIPKKYIRTFLFPQIWGETWLFGEDLKYEAIEVNKEFRESAVMALGLPAIPEFKMFLPGYKEENNIDYTVEMNPWQWMDVWVEHCKYLEKHNIKSPDEEEKSDLPETDDSDVEEPFGFLFLRNMPLYDVEYEHVNLQYFLCDRKDCSHCPYLINNIMKKEGIDHICLKIIMNKDNPDEVEKVIALPYEHVHGKFEKKERKVVLKKKKKKNDDDKVFEDEFELPFCSTKNGCLLRKLLPDYLKDSRANKMYCDQCGKVETNDNKTFEDGYDLFLEETENVINETENVINETESINKDTATSVSGVSNIIWNEEYIDNVGKFLDISQTITDKNPCSGEDKESAEGTSGISEDKCALFTTNPVDLKKNLDRSSCHSDGRKSLYSGGPADSAENQEDDKNSVNPIDLLLKNELIKCNTLTHNNQKPDVIIEGDTAEVQNHLDKFSSSSSSVTFKSAVESIDNYESANVNKKSSINKDQETSKTPKILPVNSANSGSTKCKPESRNTKSKPDTIYFQNDSDGEEIPLNIKHVLDDPYDTSRDFDEKTKKLLDAEVAKLNAGLGSKVVKKPFDVLSSVVSSHGLVEESDDEEAVDKLNLVHHVAIWSLGNDLKPMQRLISPFELTCMSFCPYNGRYLVGGTTTGQIVLWDLEGVLEHKEVNIEERSDFDLIGFKHLERMMCWFKRIRPNQKPESRLYITAISNRAASHMDKIVDISWLAPNVKLSPSSGKYEEIDIVKDGFSLQFMSTSIDGIIKCWDLNSPPIPFAEAHIKKDSFQRPGQFKLPKNPKDSKSKSKELFMRWNPFYKIRLEHHDTLSIKRFCVTYISHDNPIYSYEKDEDNASKGEINVGLNEYYKVESVALEAMNQEALVGTIDGRIVLFSLKSSSQEAVYDDQEGIGGTPIRFFKQVHDGPINKIKRHPVNNKIFLSSGGSIFALWTTNQEEPLKWKRYTDCFITAVGWSRLRASSFRVGRSDGCMEIWDMHENGNEPKMTLKVSTGAIFDFLIPVLPIPIGLFGVTDYRGVLRFYVIPWEYQLPRENEKELFFNKIEAEHQRKLLLNKIAADKMSVIEGKKSQDLDHEDLLEDDLKEEDSEEMIKRKELIGCRKFKDELYKWYLRRRGKNAAWLDEAEKKWFLKEQEYMIKTILENKKINLQELDEAIEPLYKKEKHTKDVAVKIIDMLDMADDIFKKAVQELVLVRNYQNQSQVSLEMEKMNFGELKEAMAAIDLYFGESYEKIEEELNEFVKMNPITKEWTFAELCEKNQYIRDAWNDRRRLLKKEHKWSRELIAEELEKAGYTYSCYVDHEESYLKKKYERRTENIERLKKMLGDDYDPCLDLHGKDSSRSRKKSKETETESGKKEKFNEKEDISNLYTTRSPSKHPLREVKVVLPQGSFYKKYMPIDKNIPPWEKPMPREESVYSHSKKVKDKLGESEKPVTSKTKGPANLGVEPVAKTAPPENDSDTDQSETGSSSSSSSKENLEKREEKKPHKESVDKSKGSVRFSERTKGAPSGAKEELGKKVKKEIDFEKEDITGRYHGIEDLRRLIKEKKMRGEEFIDIDDLSSYSYETVLGPISSSASSPDMSLKSEDMFSDKEDIDDDSENEYFKEQFKEFLEETPRYDPPKVVPYDDSIYEDELTEEWMEDDLKISLKPQEQEQEEESEDEEEDSEKTDVKTSFILEKEKAARDSSLGLQTMGESPDAIQTDHLEDPSGSKYERPRHTSEDEST